LLLLRFPLARWDNRADMRASRSRRPGGRRQPAFCAILAMVLLVLAAAGLPARAEPRPPVVEWLREAGIDPVDVGIAIRRLDDARGAPAWVLNAELPFNPASTLKLVTTWAAMSILGPEFRWRTSLHLRGPVA